jgi:ribonucleotide monophosphatase NagD (HAD superfamily)
MVSAIQTAAGAEPRVIGKPRTYSLEKIMAMAEALPDETIVIGDRLDTDIQLGRKAGAHTALVLTGVTTEQEARNAPPEMKPDRVIRSLLELLE